MVQRKWVLAPNLPSEAKQVYPELPDVVLNLLWHRGLKNQEKIDEFLNPDWGEDIHDPFLFRDMEKAAGRIFEAIERGEKITIHGDYDADGVCGAVILFKTLKTLGAKNVEVFLPHRETDGYGVNSNTIKNFSENGVNLIITCDCGISNAKQIEEAKNFGIDAIVTDHHEIPENIPPAFAIIHPKMPGETYPSKELSGGAVAFKLAHALILRGRERGVELPEGFEKWFLDLAAISLVADVIPLLGEARTLTKYGLIVLNKTRNLGLKELFEAAGIQTGKIDTWTIGFIIAPRINAAGRMNHANAAYKLLVSDDASEAKDLAYKLNQSNAERQKQTEIVFMEAKGQVIDKEMDKEFAIAVLDDCHAERDNNHAERGWQLGLIGLVAGKLSNEFYRPAVVCGKKDGKTAGSVPSVPNGTDGSRIVGSGRCEISGFDLLDSLRSSGDFFEKLGGHKSACGFTLKKEVDFGDFYKKWNEECKKRLEGADLSPVLYIDSELDLDDVDWRLYDILSKLEPFGEANPAPRYLAKGVTVKSLELVGSNGNHLRLTVCHKGIITKKMIGFRLGDPERAGENWCQKLKTGDKIDIVFEVGVNEWNGNREIQLKIIDLRLCQ